jgi:hypothetical protein
VYEKARYGSRVKRSSLPRPSLLPLFFAIILTAFALAACGGSSSEPADAAANDAASTPDGPVVADSGAGQDSSSLPDATVTDSGDAGDSSVASDAPNDSSVPGDSGPPIDSGTGADSGPSDGGEEGSVQGVLVIGPLAPTLTVVSGSPIPTQQFSATLNGHPPNAVTWALDRSDLGSISAAGLFTPTGSVGGLASVTAVVGGQTATTIITVNLQMTDLGDPSSKGDAGTGANGGGVGGNGPGAPPSPGQVGTLNGAPIADGTVSLLYPYDGTVWPQGLLAPLLQWNAGAYAFDSVYVHITEKYFEYKGYFASNTTGPFVNVPIPQAAWTALTASNARESVSVSVVFAQGTKAVGPYTRTWRVSSASLQGILYYDSYGTLAVKNSDSPDSYGQQYGAATLALTPGATSPKVVAGIDSPGASGDGTGCRACHTVSANGQALLAQASNANATDYSRSVAINLAAADPSAGAGTTVATANLSFPALYKDGSLALSSTGGLTYAGQTTGTSQLDALPGGGAVAGVSGLPSALQASLPAFSPDGAHVAFDFWSGSFATTSGDERSLALLDFDGKATFSGARVLFTPPAGTSVTHSSFLPGGDAVVFEVELSNPGGAWGYTWHGNTAELWWVNIATSQAQRLDALNGYAGGAPYLPNQPVPDGGVPNHLGSVDVTLNYEPNVSPIASGGYAWVVFTSRRMYGTVADLDPWQSDPRSFPWRDDVTDKKLWVAAIDLNAAPGVDPSHPAFYLPAQELHAANARGSWAAEPCRASGQGCSAGDQCCGGFCRPGGDGGALACTATAPSCANEFEKCTTASDCCGTGIECIAGLCTQPTPQ